MTDTSSISGNQTRRKARNLIGFWFLGLCNNYANVVMLSAAYDILKVQEGTSNITSVAEPEDRTGKLIPECNPTGTGAVLLADVLPGLFIKIIAPLFIDVIPYNYRVLAVVIFALCSFLTVSLSIAVWMSFLGVIFASSSGGLGESTFLSLSSYLDRNVVSTWSSGTGAAGVFGAISYAGLTSLGVAPRTAILIMISVPLLLAIMYYFVLEKPKQITSWSFATIRTRKDSGAKFDEEEPILSEKKEVVVVLSLQRKLQLIKPLALKYMLPLGLVYFAEYFINNALFELISFDNVWLKKDQQYRWFQVLYQIGVLISRSSVNIFPIRKLWILPILQFCNIGILLCQVLFRYLPNIWFVFGIILFEGILGGAAYVNTFYKISCQVNEEYRDFSMGVTTIADGVGIALAGTLAVPVHNYLCQL